MEGHYALCQQIFIYNEEAYCTSCVQVLGLPQSHFDDNRAMITVTYIHLLSARFGHFVCNQMKLFNVINYNIGLADKP